MISKLKSKLTVNKKNIAKITSGTLAGQLISIITLPIIARIYGVEVLGMWALLSSISMIINSFSDLGMTNAIMTEDEKYIEGTFKVITTLVFIISILGAAGITFYYTLISESSEVNSLFLFIFATATIFITKQIQTCYTWLNRKEEYNVLMKNPVIQYGSYGIISIALGLLGMKTYGYFIAHMASFIITLLLMKRKIPISFYTLNISEFKDTIVRNKKFVIFQTPSRVLNNIQNQMPVFLVQGLWGTEMLGYYSITVRILQVPSSLLASAIGRVFFQLTSKMKREGKIIGQYVYRNLTKGIKIGIIPMTLLMAFGDVIIIIFLGYEWKTAGDFIRIMTLQYYFMFLMNTVLGLDIILEKQQFKIITSLLQIIGFIFGALLGKYMFDDIFLGLIMMSIFYIIIQIGYFCSLFRIMNVSLKELILNILFSVVTIVLFSIAIRSIVEYFGIIDFILNYS